MSQVQKLSSISVTGFGKRRDGLLIGKIQLSLHFPKKVMSANAKTTEQLHLSPISAKSCYTSSMKDFVLSLIESFQQNRLDFAEVVALETRFPTSGIFWKSVQNLTGRSISASLTMPRPLAASGIVHCGRLCLRCVYQHTL